MSYLDGGQTWGAGSSASHSVKSFASCMKQKGNEWKSRVSKSGKEDEKKKGSRCCNQHVSDGMEWKGTRTQSQMRK